MAKFEVGDTVKVISNKGGSLNPVGSVGVITFIYEGEFGKDIIRVQVKGYTEDNMNNWHNQYQIRAVE